VSSKARRRSTPGERRIGISCMLVQRGLTGMT
jgi:hypothetical protein